MEWKSRRIEAILEQALVEDKATSDVTTALTIDPALRASATIVAKEECVLSGWAAFRVSWRFLRASTAAPAGPLTKSSAIRRFLTGFACAKGRRLP